MVVVVWNPSRAKGPAAGSAVAFPLLLFPAPSSWTCWWFCLSRIPILLSKTGSLAASSVLHSVVLGIGKCPLGWDRCTHVLPAVERVWEGDGAALLVRWNCHTRDQILLPNSSSLLSDLRSGISRLWSYFSFLCTLWAAQPLTYSSCRGLFPVWKVFPVWRVHTWIILLVEIRLQVTAFARDGNPVILGKQILTGLGSAAGKAEGMAVLGCVLPISKADELYKPSCSDMSHLERRTPEF